MRTIKGNQACKWYKLNSIKKWVNKGQAQIGKGPSKR